MNNNQNNLQSERASPLTSSPDFSTVCNNTVSVRGFQSVQYDAPLTAHLTTLRPLAVITPNARTANTPNIAAPTTYTTSAERFENFMQNVPTTPIEHSSQLTQQPPRNASAITLNPNQSPQPNIEDHSTLINECIRNEIDIILATVKPKRMSKETSTIYAGLFTTTKSGPKKTNPPTSSSVNASIFSSPTISNVTEGQKHKLNAPKKVLLKRPETPTKSGTSNTENKQLKKPKFDSNEVSTLTVNDEPHSVTSLRVKQFAMQRENILTQDSGYFELSQPDFNESLSSVDNLASINASPVTDLNLSPPSSSTAAALIEASAEPCLEIATLGNPANLNQELLGELNEAWNFAPLNDLDLFAPESAADTPDTSLINQLLNEPVPDQKDFLFDLHKVPRPRNTDQFSFYAQKQRTNQILKDVFETLNTAPVKTELAQDPVGLTVPLMQHQRHALKFMQFLEKRHPYGGLLADDMGLGKTLSMLALVMAEKNRFQSGEAESNVGACDANTLVVCPPSLLHQWEKEVCTRFDYTLLPLVFHGKVNKADIENIKNFDVVITTYDTLLNHRLAQYINKLLWRRVILDEAHIIRNPSTQKSQAVCGLSANHRWALTGTPIHNKETDVFALLKFLKYKPFDEYSYWNIWLSGYTRLGVLLRSIMLRRTKEELKRQNMMFDLPPQSIKIFEIKLSDDEMRVHQAILSFSRPLVRRYIQQYLKRQDPTILAGVRSATEKDQLEFLRKFKCDEANIGQHVIYVLLLRLTQVCCHPGLAEPMLYDNLESDDGQTGSNLTQQNYNEINVKTEPNFNDVYVKTEPNFNDIFVKTEPNVKTEPQTGRARLSTVRQILDRKNPIFDLRYPSSKMLKVLQILQERVFITNDKAVIVSQYTAYLSIIEHFLKSKNIPVLNFNGKMSLDDRQKSLDEFNYADSGSKVLLLSLKCGGVGLNLTAANHLILMDLPWNPQLEAQAQDRIYRLGQTKPVFVYKFLCTNTVEEHIKMKQDHKLKLASSVLTGADSLQNSGARFSIVELKKLFGIND